MNQYYEGIGRRKQSTARVRVMSGSGKFVVNEREVEEYFGRISDMESIMRPFKAIDRDRATFDVSVKVSGGGVTGQSESVRLGLSRADRKSVV